MAMAKVIIVVFVIVVGFFKIVVRPVNSIWVLQNWSHFVTNGFKAVVTGEMAVFFAYAGLDAVAISIEECRNPHRNPLKDAWALFPDQDALNIFTGEWIPNPKAPYYTNLSGWASHKHQTCMKCGYTCTPCDLKSYFEGIKEYIEKPSYAPGGIDIQCTIHKGLTEAIKIATEAEVVMVVLADSLQLYFLVRGLGLLAMTLLNDIVTNDSEGHLSKEAKKLSKSLESHWGDGMDSITLQVIPLKGIMTNEVFQINWLTKTGEL
ncbi:hypothetical protein NE237_003736 [Protea cynaroides]|uniref:Uncharacterized protein n=1 Tax=Protea cynaroides TaxID=273540 RepID=A0A9Q0KHK6_9MAGN|nr:hypothetical protein NE237_003736 [Protea cynaroides]